MTKLATACINVTYSKEKNLKKYFEYVDEAASKGAKLIVFPEQSLQGYLPSLVALQDSTFSYQYENAEVVPDGTSIRAIMKKAKEKDMYIIFGMTEKDEDCYHKLYNTMVLVGPEGYIGRYRKVHQPLDELHVYYGGKEFPVFDTAIGKIGMLICYDKAFPESARELALQGAELLVMSTAWPLANPEGDYKTDHMKFLFDLYDKVRAVENQCFFISSNHIGVSGDITYLGHSRIVAPDGTVLDETGFKEGIAYADVNIKAEIIKGKTKGFLGLNLLKDRRPEAYAHIGL